MALLELKNLRVAYGHIEAVRGISLKLEKSAVATLLGANGAGKSSTLLAISGLVHSSGEILFEGESIGGLPPHRIAERGLIQLPEGRAILAGLSVRENLELGAYARHMCRAEVGALLEQQLARFPILNQRIDALAGNLSGGEQQMLALARALMAKPRLLLLDEPSMGLAPLIVREIFEILAEINSSGVPLLVVEQNVRLALQLAQHGWVLESGRIALMGTAGELLEHPELVSSYLGESPSASATTARR